MSPHDTGYKAFKKNGLTARNPFSPGVAKDHRAQWQAGFDKAQREHRNTSFDKAQREHRNSRR